MQPYIKILFICFVSLLTSCIRHGAESVDVKFKSYEFYPAYSTLDTSYYLVSYENKSDEILKNPYLRISVKDTSDKVFKKIIFSDSKNFNSVNPNSSFTVKFNVTNDIDFTKVGKIKFFLSWTNSKNKTSVRRTIRYF